MIKNEKILRRWVVVAFKKARKDGFVRLFYEDKLIEQLMSPPYCFTTVPEDKKTVINIVYRIFMDWEKLCQFINEKNICETNVKLAKDILRW